MEILAYHKKKKTWSLTLDERGQIQTGRSGCGYNNAHEIDVPIFRAKLKYSHHSQGTRSILIHFKGCDEDSIIAILQGTGPCKYMMDKDDGFEILDGLILRNNPAYEYHEDGWFTGVFTFKKNSQRVFITPYRGNIEDEKPA